MSTSLSSWSSGTSVPPPVACRPKCDHNIQTELLTSRTEDNRDRRYYRCAAPEEDDCGFFEWLDDEPEERSRCPKYCGRIRQAYKKNYESWGRDKDDTIGKLLKENTTQAADIARADAKLEAAESTLEAYKKGAFFLSVCVFVVFAYCFVAY